MEHLKKILKYSITTTLILSIIELLCYMGTLPQKANSLSEACYHSYLLFKHFCLAFLGLFILSFIINSIIQLIVKINK